MKVLLVGSDPVGCNFILGRRERHFSLAHELMKARLECILNVRVPVGGRVWLRPKVSNVSCATQLGRDQVIDLVGIAGRERQTIFTENLPLQRSIDRKVGLGLTEVADTFQTNGTRGAWSESSHRTRVVRLSK